MTFSDFDDLVRRAIDAMPEEFRRRLDNVAILPEEEPSPDIMEDMGVGDPGELLGYHTGVSQLGQEEGFTGLEPDRILIFRRGCEDEAAESGLPLREVVRETLFHEVGHYFGLTEGEMDEIEAEWRRGN